MIKYRIPITAIKQSTNAIYAGSHWAKRRKFKDSVLDYAGIFCRPIKRNESYPVEILYRFVFASKPLDTTNCSYLVKCFEDALRALEIIEDDDFKHVARTIIEVAKTKVEKEDWLEIEINSIKPLC